MFQATRRRLALWYTAVTAVLLLLFATGFYLYFRTTLVERIDDTLSHVVEVVQRSLVIEPIAPSKAGLELEPSLRVNVEASFRDNASTVDDDRIDLEWFSPTGELLWSTLSAPLEIPIHINRHGETVHVNPDQLLRQITQRVQVGRQVLGYLRVSHPWFEVTKPTRQLLVDLGLGTSLMIFAVAAIGWFLSGLAIAPVRESYQQLKQFTADASHELRNPIAVIQTNVQVALSDPNPDVQFQQYQLKVIERLIRRLGRLVDDLLFLARQDSGMSPPQFASVEMDALLVEVLEEQQAIALDQDITLSLRLADSESPDTAQTTQATWPRSSLGTDHSLTILGDRDQLIRLLTNLVSNALQYTPAGGEVELDATWVMIYNHPYLQIKVQDSGIGIPAEALPHLFDRFYRVDPARTHNGLAHPQKQIGKSETTGSGLGLAIAQVIVQNHQGTIRIDSKLHQGTTVTVNLPKTREAAT